MSDHDSDDDFLFTTMKRRKPDLFETPAETSTAGVGPLKHLLDTKLPEIDANIASIMSEVSDLREKVDQQLEGIKTNMQSMLEHVIELTTVNERMHVPLPLQITINDLECIIYKDCPPTPPIMVSSCCKAIIGCKPCVVRWYGSQDVLERNCPRCSTRGAIASTFQLTGLDNLLTAVADVARFRALNERAEDQTSPAHDDGGDESDS